MARREKSNNKPSIIKGSNVKRRPKKKEEGRVPGPGDYNYDPTHKEV